MWRPTGLLRGLVALAILAAAPAASVRAQVGRSAPPPKAAGPIGGPTGTGRTPTVPDLRSGGGSLLATPQRPPDLGVGTSAAQSFTGAASAAQTGGGASSGGSSEADVSVQAEDLSAPPIDPVELEYLARESFEAVLVRLPVVDKTRATLGSGW